MAAMRIVICGYYGFSNAGDDAILEASVSLIRSAHADASISGFWLARTFPTAQPNSVVVPSIPQPGFAAAAALISALVGRPAIGIIDGPPDEASLIILEMAKSRGVPMALQAWVPEEEAAGPALSADEHVAASLAGFEGGEPRLDEVAVTDSEVESLVEVAGEISAWSAES